MFADMQNTVPRIENISYIKKYNKTVIRQWKQYVIDTRDDEMGQFKYKKPRKCLKCSLSFEDSAHMLIHIRYQHIKKPVTQSVPVELFLSL